MVCGSTAFRAAELPPPCVRGFFFFRPALLWSIRRRISSRWILIFRFACHARIVGGHPPRIYFSWPVQFSDKSSGICASSLFLQPPLLFKTFCQSWSGGV